MRIADPIALARDCLFVRENPPGSNRGAWVQTFQRAVDLQPGEPWCMAFVWDIFNDAYEGKCPLLKSGSTHAVLTDCRRRGWEVSTPQVGDLYFFLDGDHAHHVGIVTVIAPLLAGIAGNTSPDGLSSNGTGVFEHAIHGRMTFVRVPL